MIRLRFVEERRQRKENDIHCNAPRLLPSEEPRGPVWEDEKVIDLLRENGSTQVSLKQKERGRKLGRHDFESMAFAVVQSQRGSGTGKTKS